MNQQKYLFIDRDGTLIEEPSDQQIDSLEKLKLMPGVISALQQLSQAGFRFVMITNQDGLGTDRFPMERFLGPQKMLLQIFESQGIQFEDIKICPHLQEERCDCRKPKVGLLLDYLKEQVINRERSFVIGDRDSDQELARNVGIPGLRFIPKKGTQWNEITNTILNRSRKAVINRKTDETDITIAVNLDESGKRKIETGIEFFDHMLDQLAKHANINLQIQAKGDLDLDDHHTIEDTALVLGCALKKALGDKRGIGRYGFLLPMDESLAEVAIDLSGRPYFEMRGSFNQDRIADFSTAMVPHFFRSFSDTIGAALHIKIRGENAHHMVEAIFKGVGRTLKEAFAKSDQAIPSTKGVL